MNATPEHPIVVANVADLTDEDIEDWFADAFIASMIAAADGCPGTATDTRLPDEDPL